MSISIDIARRVLEASKQRARELRSPVSIAIVDAGGHLVLFERMMSPYGWATSNISIAKASTAVMFNQPTDAVAQWGSSIPGFASSMASMTEGKFIMAAGGWPIRLGGATIGGIGVSGGNAPGRDDEIARAGLGALEAMAPPIPAQQPTPPMQQGYMPAQPVPVAGPMQQGYMPAQPVPAVRPMQQGYAPAQPAPVTPAQQASAPVTPASSNAEQADFPPSTQHLPPTDQDNTYSDSETFSQTKSENVGGQP